MTSRTPKNPFAEGDLVIPIPKLQKSRAYLWGDNQYTKAWEDGSTTLMVTTTDGDHAVGVVDPAARKKTTVKYAPSELRVAAGAERLPDQGRNMFTFGRLARCNTELPGFTVGKTYRVYRTEQGDRIGLLVNDQHERVQPPKSAFQLVPLAQPVED